VTGSTLVDIGVGLLLFSYAVAGYRTGLVRGAFALVGFVLGAIVGLWLVPILLRSTGIGKSSEFATTAVAVIGVFLAASIGQVIGAGIGGRVRSVLVHGPFRLVDSTLGAIAQVVVTAALVWFIAATVRPAAPPAVSTALSGSRILRVIDQAVPDDASRYFEGFRDLLDKQGFPRVFTGLAPEPIAPVAPPDAAATGSAGLQRASRSIVKVVGSASCNRTQEGSGWVLSPHRVVTNAHVVAGVDEPTVQILGQGVRFPTRIVLFDPAKDIAVLDVPGLPAAALTQGAHVASGTSVAVAGFPLDGPYAVTPARVRSTLTATGEDIYGKRSVTRSIYSIYGTVEPGNSGGPLLTLDGSVIGVVFARSVEDATTGYALTLAEVAPDLVQGVRADATVDSGACTAD